MNALTKIDVTRYRFTDLSWLLSNGFHLEMMGNRVFAVRTVH